MKEFLQTNWKDILEILISLILGFIGGYSYKSLLSNNSSKIKGNNNIVVQKGNDYYERKKQK